MISNTPPVRLFLAFLSLSLLTGATATLSQQSSSSTSYLAQQLTAESLSFQDQAALTSAQSAPSIPLDDDEIKTLNKDLRRERKAWRRDNDDMQIEFAVTAPSQATLRAVMGGANLPTLNAGQTVTVTPQVRTEVVNPAELFDEDEYNPDRYYYAFQQVQQTVTTREYPVYEREDWDDVEEYTAPFTSATMLGDMDDNDETDLWPLNQARPVLNTFEPTNASYSLRRFRNAVDSQDIDEVVKTTLLQQTQVLNPLEVTNDLSVATDAQTLQTITNPLIRDTDDLPDDADDDGSDPSDGDLQFLLVTSFTDNTAGSGKVWVIPKDSDDRDDGFVLIGGLQQPVGVCFDVNNEFLYVVDLTSESSGAIYQYEIDWDDDDKFELKKPEYTVVYQGQSPYDCSVDEYGNLFFVDPSANQVNMINYLDLWSGFLNQHIVLYSAVDDLVVSRPIAIETYEKKQVYWLNSENENSNGLLITAPGRSEFMSDRRPTASVRDSREPFGIAVSDDYVYYTLSDGSVWAYDREDRDQVKLKTSGVMGQPRGACYGDDHVYVADHASGTIYRMKDNGSLETPDPFIRVDGAYNVHCVNEGSWLALGVALLLSLA